MIYYGYDYDEMMDRCRGEIYVDDASTMTEDELEDLIEGEADRLCKIWLEDISDNMPEGYVYDADTGMIDCDDEDDDEEVEDYDEAYWDDLIEDSWYSALDWYNKMRQEAEHNDGEE